MLDETLSKFHMQEKTRTSYNVTKSYISKLMMILEAHTYVPSETVLSFGVFSLQLDSRLIYLAIMRRTLYERDARESKEPEKKQQIASIRQ